MSLLEHVRHRTHMLREPSAAEISRDIHRAFRHEADEDANEITVTVAGHTVILRGTVTSWYERLEAERTAANASGTREVINELTIRA